MSADPAIARYLAHLRRARLRYAALLGVLVALVGAGVAVAWSTGEIAHVSSHTVRTGPRTLRVAAPSAAPQLGWRTTDRSALGQPRWRGTVVTYSAHAVRGRDARTGKPTWWYARTDRTVCAALQTAGTTVAVYADNGNCDEVTALDSDTGALKWTRTLDEDGKPLNGTPTTYQLLSYTVLISSPQVIYAIDPGSGIDRWVWYHYGCTIHHVVLGSAGALISQTCTKAQNCNGHIRCGPGPQLLLRDGEAGYDDTNAKNPDQVLWNRFGSTDVPVSADSVISAVNPAARSLDTFAAEHGRRTASVRLLPAPARLRPVQAEAADTAEVVSVGKRTYAVDNATVRWSTRTAAPPTVVSPSGAAVLELATARITAPVRGRVAELSGRTGRVVRSFPVAARAATAVWPFGTGFLVASPTGTAAYR